MTSGFHLLIRICSFRRRNQLCCHIRYILKIAGCIQAQVDKRFGHDERKAGNRRGALTLSTGQQSVFKKRS